MSALWKPTRAAYFWVEEKTTRRSRTTCLELLAEVKGLQWGLKQASDELKQLAKAEVGDSMCEDLLMCKQM